MSQKLYAIAEHAALTGTTKDCKQDRLQSVQVSGTGGSVGVNSTTTYSSLGPWQSELLRSQSADAVHTCKQGQVRSIHWRRDQTRKVSCGYELDFSWLSELFNYFLYSYGRYGPGDIRNSFHLVITIVR